MRLRRHAGNAEYVALFPCDQPAWISSSAGQLKVFMELIEDGLWYALHVRPRFEKVVARNLHDKGYEEYLPIYRRRSRWSDRTKQIDLPLFPGYVFCKFNVRERLPILMVPGVHAVVGVGKNPQPVSESELAGVRAVLNSGSAFEPWPFLEVGEQVEVEYGPLAGTHGIVQMFKNTYRLVISINLLQRSVAVEIDRECLKPLSSRPTTKVASPGSVILAR